MRVQLFAVLLAAGAVPAAAQTLPADSMELGRQYADWFLEGRSDSLWAHSSEGFQNSIETPEWFAARRDDVLSRAGALLRMVEQRYVRRNGDAQFWYTGEFMNAPEPVMIRLVISPTGMIDGFGMNLASQAPATDP